MSPSGPDRRRRNTLRTIGTLVMIAAACTLGATAAFTQASLTSTPSAPNTVSTMTVGAPTGVVGTPFGAFNCFTVSVAWTAGANATGYEVDYQNGSSGWNMLVANTPSSPYVDASGSAVHLNTPVTYRVTSLKSGTTWTTTSATSAAVNCGIGPVTDLTATNQCINDVIEWTTPYNVTGTYKVEYSMNAAAYVSLGNIAATVNGANSYINSATLTPTLTKGTTYAYRITPNSGAGSLSNIPATITWDGFYVNSVAIANTGVLGTLAAGDTITVDFSKTVSETGVNINDNDMTIRPNVSRKKLFLANAGVTTNNGAGLRHQ